VRLRSTVRPRLEVVAVAPGGLVARFDRVVEADQGVVDQVRRRVGVIDDVMVIRNADDRRRQVDEESANRARILKVSHRLLGQVARALKDVPSVAVRIEGHTDNVGRLEDTVDPPQRGVQGVTRALLGGVSNGPFYEMKRNPDRTLDADRLTPLAALSLLASLQSRLKNPV